MTNENTQQLAYPGVYARESDIIPYSPRKQFRFMDSATDNIANENTQGLAYPGVYARESDIIPYSPRKQFRFMDDVTDGRTIKLESMKDMSVDQIVELYKNGFRIEDTSQTLSTSKIGAAASDITVSSDVIVLVGAGLLIYMLAKKK